MPSGVFKPYAGVSTAVIVFQKGGTTDNVWFYDMEADGFSLDDKRQKVETNDIPDIIKQFSIAKGQLAISKAKENNRKNKSFFVTVDEIRANKYDLSISRYKEIEHKEIEYEKPAVILDKVLKMEKEIEGELKALRKLIK
jgi:type I restriction enzyme M protein